MRIAVLGAGAWGTALAAAAAPRHTVCLWARDATQAAQMVQERANPRYLPGVALPANLAVLANFEEALTGTELVVVATPMAGLRECLARVPQAAPVLWLCKGFEAGSGALGHEIARELRPGRPCAVLSGPSFADEVARGQPTALVAAGEDTAFLERIVAAFHSETLRVYTSSDIVGVEVGGAVKNVLAIAAGIVDGLASDMAQPGLPGLNARAALITRGLAEMSRLGVALGGRAETFMGLSGLGDLVLTATGALSRNRRVGLGLAAGRSLAQVLADLGHVAEGVQSAAVVVQRAQALGVEMPICEAVVQVLQGRIAPALAIRQLMLRQPRAETHAPSA
jgi:glycerol-3-phosphate dehydrogenase (NAD(P)+)